MPCRVRSLITIAEVVLPSARCGILSPEPTSTATTRGSETRNGSYRFLWPRPPTSERFTSMGQHAAPAGCPAGSRWTSPRQPSHEALPPPDGRATHRWLRSFHSRGRSRSDARLVHRRIRITVWTCPRCWPAGPPKTRISPPIVPPGARTDASPRADPPLDRSRTRVPTAPPAS